MRLYVLFKNIFFALILLQFAPVLIKNIVNTYSDIAEPKTRVAVIPIKGVIYACAPCYKTVT